ncbi:unnamed protein product, partial [Scytosiphon promiscuus]
AQRPTRQQQARRSRNLTHSARQTRKEQKGGCASVTHEGAGIGKSTESTTFAKNKEDNRRQHDTTNLHPRGWRQLATLARIGPESCGRGPWITRG